MCGWRLFGRETEKTLFLERRKKPLEKPEKKMGQTHHRGLLVPGYTTHRVNKRRKGFTVLKIQIRHILAHSRRKHRHYDGENRMNDKCSILHVIKVMHDMGFQRRRSNYFIWWFLALEAGFMLFFAFAFLFTALDTFAWLLYGTTGMGIVGGVFGIIWRMQEAIKQIKNGKFLYL